MTGSGLFRAYFSFVNSEPGTIHRAESRGLSLFLIAAGLASLAVTVTFLFLLESRRSTTVELARAGFALYCLVPIIRGVMRRKKDVNWFAFIWRRILALPNIVLAATALLVAVSCLEGIGYQHRQLVQIIKASFYVFILYLQIRDDARGEIGTYLVIAQLLLPWNSVFFSWNSFLQPAMLCVFLLFLYELLRRETKTTATPLNWFDALVAAYAGLFVVLFPLAQNYQDAFLRLSYFAVLFGFYGIARRFFSGTLRSERLLRAFVAVGSVYTISYLALHLFDVMGFSFGWPIDKSRKGQLITTHIAQHFMVMAPLALLFLRRGRAHLANLAIFALCLVSMIDLLFTLARGSMGALGISLLACFFVAAILRNRRLLIFGLVFTLVLAAGVGLLFYMSDNTDLTGSFTLRQRLGLWYQALEILRTDWLTGTGSFISFHLFGVPSTDPARAPVVREAVIRVAPWIAPHNLYLALLLSGGIFSFISFFSIFGVIFSVLGKTIIRARGSRSLRTLLFAVLFLCFPIVGLTESLVSTPIPNFLIWINWAIFAVFFRREIQVIFRRPRPRPRLSPIAAGTVKTLALVVFLVICCGNFFFYRGAVPISGLQDRVRGLLVLDPLRHRDEAAIQERLNRCEAWLRIARVLLPYDWRPRQLLGEISLVHAARDPARATEFIREAEERYGDAIRLNHRFPLLHLRIAEIYDMHDRWTGTTLFAEPAKRARARAAELDPHFAYRGFWNDSTKKIE